MKKKRHLLIALGVLAGFCVLYGAFTLMGEKDPPAKRQEESIAVNDRTDIVSVRIEPKGEKPFVISIDEKAKGKRSLWIEGYESSFAFDIPALVKLVSGLERLKAYAMIEDRAEKYGINEESPKAILCFEDKTMLTLRFGNETFVPGQIYVEAEEKGCIYVIRKDIGDICNKSLYAFRKPQLLANYLKQRESLLYAHIEMDRDDGNRIVIRPQRAEEARSNKSDSPSLYVIEEPVFWECSDGKIDSLIHTPVLALEEKALVVEDFPKDLTAYGLTEDSAFLRFTLEDAVCKILLGRETEDGYVYAMQEGMPSVVKIPKDVLTMMNLEWFDFINTSLWMRSIDKLSSFTLSTSEKTYEMVLVRDEKGKISGGLLNGISVEESDVREIYMKVLNIHIEGKNPHSQVMGSPEYKITLHLLDGRDEPREFTSADGRNYVITEKGQGLGFYTGIKGIEELCRSLEALE
jgi:hypothetical protein